MRWVPLKCQNIWSPLGTEPQNETITWLYRFYRQSKAATELHKTFSSCSTQKITSQVQIKTTQPSGWCCRECSFKCIISRMSQSMHLTFLASTMLVVLLTTKKTIHYPSVLNFSAWCEWSVCTKTCSFSPSTVLTGYILCYLPTQSNPLPSPHQFSFYLDIILSP